MIRLSARGTRIAVLAVAGTLFMFIILGVILGIGDTLGRPEPGALFVAAVALLSLASFVCLLIPKYAEPFNARVSTPRIIDPMTGKPLRLLWWFRWFTGMLALFLLVGVSDYVSSNPTTSTRMAMIARAQTPETITELSRKAGMLTMYMARSEVIDKLGAPPTWVFLPGDPSDFAPKGGALVTLIWKNGLCAHPVAADFDADQKLVGWDEGRGRCVTTEAENATSLPPVGKYDCADTRRSIYCRGVE